MTAVADKSLFHVKLKVRTSLFTGKCTVHLSNKTEAPAGVHDYDFYVGAWMGRNNKNMEYNMLKGQEDGTGVAEICVPVRDSDTNALKLGIYIRDPETQTMRHIASGFRPLTLLASDIDGVDDFKKAASSVLLKDNYSRNQTLLHFANAGTDVKEMKKFCAKLEPSVLSRNNEINTKVLQMTFGLHDWIEKASQVSNTNGGPNFVNSMCFTEGMGCAINYPLLDMTYSSERHRVPLAMLTYAAFATLQYCRIPPETLLAMPAQDFVAKYAMPLCTSFTVCPASSVYSGDKTIDPKGNLDLGTEDFAMVLSSHFFTHVRNSFKSMKCENLGDKTDNELRELIGSIVANPNPESLASKLISDDCETMTGLVKSFDGGVHKYHLKAVAAAGGNKKKSTSRIATEAPGQASKSLIDLATPADLKLADMTWDATRGLNNMALIPKKDFVAIAMLLNRSGSLSENNEQGKVPCKRVALSIVSAKGASFELGNKDLNGHACSVSQTLCEDGSVHYKIGEATANMATRDLPGFCPSSVKLALSNGEKAFSTLKALTCVAQNMSEYVKTNGKLRVEQCIPASFHGIDIYKDCPFYMAGFFIGFKMGKCIPGVIPLDVKNISSSGSGRSVLASDAARMAPVFGAPVANLSGDNVKALPIDLGKVMGETQALEFLKDIEMRNAESYPPRASKATLKKVVSHWMDLNPVDKMALNSVSDKVWISSIAEGFDDSDLGRAMLEYKSRLARKFNALQAEDSLSDGVTMTVHGHMLSAICQFHIPLPTTDGLWRLSCARNMRLAVEAVPLRSRTGVAGQVSVGCDLGVLA